ncbi:MAG: hypothetical protein DYG98_16065 [Haliscomenobacteraceae bacterium CHB4]|nr:hypothetical protein [Saprospiraceae bacterium]MCE7924563.1 hypothetical protein [Haliscomenobacteraceae bacterium CHB4]
MSLLAPVEGWYAKKVARDEKMWMLISFVLCLMLFVWMLLWHVYGEQNPSNVTYRTTPVEFSRLHEAYIKKNMIGIDNGVPVVKPEPKSDVFFMGEMWRWSPALILQKGEWYNLHISSKDLMHGFSLQPVNMNFQVYPGYDYVLHFKPTEAGEYKVLCNEFCGIGHHTMIGKIVVIENDEDLKKYGYDFPEKSAVPAPGTDTAPATATEVAPASAEADIKAGELVYTLKGCVACHKTDGTAQLAPAWNGLFGKKEKVKENGKEIEVTVDEAYIRESIVTPQQKVTVGYEQTVMPVFALNDEEIRQVTAFVKSLQNK